MFKPNIVLVLAIFHGLLVSSESFAVTEREMIVNSVHTAVWAYHTADTDFSTVSLTNSRWYITPLVSVEPTDVFSLGSTADRSQAGWWTVGTGVAHLDSSMSSVTVEPNIDSNTTDHKFIAYVFDIGMHQEIANQQIHSDRQLVQGKTHPIPWYFFQAPTGDWYIVSAPGYSKISDVRALSVNYSWRSVDVSGYRVVLTPFSSGRSLSLTFVPAGPPGFLNFPLDYRDGPYTQGTINSVLDHHITTPYANDKTILSFTGEQFLEQSPYLLNTITNPSPCYPKDSNAGNWSALLQYLYKGTSGTGATNCTKPALPNYHGALNYDDHPGYDYLAGCTTSDPNNARSPCLPDTGKAIYAAYTGTVVGENGGCVPKGFSVGETCQDWGAIGIDHGNGYITQYLHLDLSTVTVSPGQVLKVDRMFIGRSGNTSPTKKPVGPHLHFEVLRLRPGATNDHKAGSYATVDPYGFDDSKGILDYMIQYNQNLPNVCLWKDGCRFQ